MTPAYLLIKKHKNLISYFIIYVFTLAILYMLLQHVGIYRIEDEIKKSEPVYIFFAFILSIIFVILSGFKLKLFIAMMGQDIRISRCIKLIFATYPLNVFIPSKGGDFLKSWSLRDILPISHGIGIVIIERLIDILILCLLTLMSSILIRQLTISTVSFSIILIMFLFFYLIHKLPFMEHNKNKLSQKILKTGYPFKCLLDNKKFLIGVFSISLIIWIGSIFQVYLLYLSIGQTVPFLYSFTAVPIAIFIGFMPVTIAGMGTRDLALVYLFSAYADNSSSVIVGLYLSLLRYWILALIGLPFIQTLKGRN